MRLSRRSLYSIAAGGMLAWLPRNAPAARGGGDITASRQDALMRLCAELPLRTALAEACRAALPAAETSEAALTHAILATLPPADCSDGRQDLRRRIGERVREDFGNDKVVIVEGWVLSVTETRVYALAAFGERAARQL